LSPLPARASLVVLTLNSMKTILLLIVAALLGPGSLHAGEKAPYNTKVSYREKETLAFLDFSLVYTGVSKANPPKGLHAWTIHHFTVTSKEGEQKITWSAGTGDIGPTLFQVGAQKFLLELLRSDTLGKLAEGELVIRLNR